MILLCDVKEREVVQALGLRIIDAVKQPFALGGRDIFIGVSISVAPAAANAIEKEDWKRKADIALYAANTRGRDGFQWFEQSLDKSLRAGGADGRSSCRTSIQRHLDPLFPAAGRHHKRKECWL